MRGIFSHLFFSIWLRHQPRLTRKLQQQPPRMQKIGYSPKGGLAYSFEKAIRFPGPPNAPSDESRLRVSRNKSPS